MSKEKKFSRALRFVIVMIFIIAALYFLYGAQNATALSPAKIIFNTPWAVYNDTTCDVTVSVTKGIPACMLQFTVTYDATCFEVLNTAAGTVFDGCGVPTINALQAGEIILCWDGITPLSEKGTLLTITIKAKKVVETTQLCISDEHDFVCCDENFAEISTVRQNTHMAVVDQMYKLGDVNRDKVINTGDAVIVLRFSVGSYTLSDAQLFLGDYNKDTKLNSGDACAIMRACLDFNP